MGDDTRNVDGIRTRVVFLECVVVKECLQSPFHSTPGCIKNNKLQMVNFMSISWWSPIKLSEALLMVDELNYLIDSVPITEDKFKYFKCIYNCRVEDWNWQEFSWNWHHIIVFVYMCIWTREAKEQLLALMLVQTQTQMMMGLQIEPEHQMRTKNVLSSAKASSFLIISNYLHNSIIPGYHEHRMSKRTFILMLMLLGWLRLRLRLRLVRWSKWGRISD